MQERQPEQDQMQTRRMNNPLQGGMNGYVISNGFEPTFADGEVISLKTKEAYTPEESCACMVSPSPSKSCCTEKEVADYYREHEKAQKVFDLKYGAGTKPPKEAERERSASHKRRLERVEQRKAQMNRGFLARLFGGE